MCFVVVFAIKFTLTGDNDAFRYKLRQREYYAILQFQYDLQCRRGIRKLIDEHTNWFSMCVCVKCNCFDVCRFIYIPLVIYFSFFIRFYASVDCVFFLFFTVYSISFIGSIIDCIKCWANHFGIVDKSILRFHWIWWCHKRENIFEFH